MAQSASDSQPPAPPSKEAPKAAGKPQTGDKKAAPATPAKETGGYATEADARAHCRGGVVWVDKDHFNQYPGSREYGRKPGHFACEQG
jgi:hypothetical protein